MLSELFLFIFFALLYSDHITHDLDVFNSMFHHNKYSNMG